MWYILFILANKKTMPGKSKFTVWPYSFYTLKFLGIIFFVITLVLDQIIMYYNTQATIYECQHPLKSTNHVEFIIFIK